METVGIHRIKHFNGLSHDMGYVQDRTVWTPVDYRRRADHEGDYYAVRDNAVAALFPAYSWPGGYVMEYTDGDGSLLCAECARQEFRDGEREIYAGCTGNYEVSARGSYCDSCNAEIVAPHCTICGEESPEGGIAIAAEDDMDDMQGFCRHCVALDRQRERERAEPRTWDRVFEFTGPGSYFAYTVKPSGHRAYIGLFEFPAARFARLDRAMQRARAATHDTAEADRELAEMLAAEAQG